MKRATATCLAAVGLVLARPLPAPSVEAGSSGLNRYRAWRERPLFSPTRRPPSPAEPPAGADAAPPPSVATGSAAPDISVSGIILGLQTRIAIVRQGHNPIAIHVTVGSSVDGWTVSAIGARDVTLQRDRDSVSIRLPTSGSPAP